MEPRVEQMMKVKPFVSMNGYQVLALYYAPYIGITLADINKWCFSLLPFVCVCVFLEGKIGHVTFGHVSKGQGNILGKYRLSAIKTRYQVTI